MNLAFSYLGQFVKLYSLLVQVLLKSEPNKRKMLSAEVLCEGVLTHCNLKIFCLPEMSSTRRGGLSC